MVIVVGVLLIATAVALQLYLMVALPADGQPRARRRDGGRDRPRRRDASRRLSAEAGHLRVAKQDAFDSIIALTQARAVSYDANADESRYLVDPGRAAQYQQAFLVKSQQIADVGPVGIFGYDAALAADIRAYDADNAEVRFGGYLGAEFRNITFPGERAAAVRTLLAYQVYERDDRVLRALAKSNLAAAVAFDIGTAASQSDWAFNRYDAALSSVIAINSRRVHRGRPRRARAVPPGTSGFRPERPWSSRCCCSRGSGRGWPNIAEAGLNDRRMGRAISAGCAIDGMRGWGETPRTVRENGVDLPGNSRSRCRQRRSSVTSLTGLAR